MNTDANSVINRCSDIELAKLIFNHLLRDETPDIELLNNFKRSNYDEYNELVEIAKCLTNTNYYITSLGDIEEVTAYKWNNKYFGTKQEAIRWRDRICNIEKDSSFWIPKIGQTIYLTVDYKIKLRIVTDVSVRYDGNTRDCIVYHKDPKTGETDYDYIRAVFNTLEDCCDW